MEDSGKREQFPSGSVRDTRQDKGRYDLIPAPPLARLARIYELGARKYAEDNWRKGQNLRRYLDSLKRHITRFELGENQEDHLAQAAWNLFSLMWTMAMIEAGFLPKSLDDLPQEIPWEGRWARLGLSPDMNAPREASKDHQRADWLKGSQKSEDNPGPNEAKLLRELKAGQGSVKMDLWANILPSLAQGENVLIQESFYRDNAWEEAADSLRAILTQEDETRFVEKFDEFLRVTFPNGANFYFYKRVPTKAPKPLPSKMGALNEASLDDLWNKDRLESMQARWRELWNQACSKSPTKKKQEFRCFFSGEMTPIVRAIGAISPDDLLGTIDREKSEEARKEGWILDSPKVVSWLKSRGWM